MVRISDTCQAKVANFEIASCVQQKIGRFQVTVQNVCRVDVPEIVRKLKLTVQLNLLIFFFQSKD